MHSVLLVDLAAVVSEHGPAILYGRDTLSPEALTQYWTATHARFGLWHQAMARYSRAEQTDDEQAMDTWWSDHTALMEEILVSEILTRVVAALGADEDDLNSGSEDTVARSIRWCQDEYQAHIISLSLGGEQNVEMHTEGSSVSAVRRAVDSGIFVVAAAGNDGGGSDDGLVSVPGNVPRVITVGASTESQSVWANSSSGSQSLMNGEQRQHPHMKPEVIAPGENIISTGSNFL